MGISIRVGPNLMPYTLPLAFTQQCLRSLESLGDNAMTSQNYTEAIARYSMTLSMGPATQEGILIKRSKAYAAAHVWDDVLKGADEVCLLLVSIASEYAQRCFCRGN